MVPHGLLRLIGRENNFDQCLIRYPVCGGMQDFNYLASNAFELTFELGCRKFPPGKDLENLWKDNQQALINFITQV